MDRDHIGLIASDMDYTLLDENGRLPEGFGRLVRLLEEERPDMVVATHPLCAQLVSRWKQETGVSLPLITCLPEPAGSPATGPAGYGPDAGCRHGPAYRKAVPPAHTRRSAPPA